MSVRVYLQVCDDGSPITPCVSAAWEALRFLGHECRPFEMARGRYPPPNGDMIVGSVEACHAEMSRRGVCMPEPLDYPEPLREWMFRGLDSITLAEARDWVREEPAFVKPVRPKVFAGAVYDSDRELYDETAHLADDERVWISGIVDFRSEFRCFVRDGGLVGMRHYRGDPFAVPHRGEVIRMVRAVSDLGIAGMAFDVGVLADGRTALVECNDGYALGYYGLDSLTYAELLIARWSQIVG